MCVRASLSAVSALDLPPTTDSVPIARRFVRDALRSIAGSRDVDIDVDTAVLLASELVTNAVLHARSPFNIVVAERATDLVRVEVRDGSPVPPRMHSFSTMSATGRGLRLLEQLAEAWGVESGADGKVVWFEVGRPDDAAWESYAVEDLLGEGVPGDF